MGRLIKYAVFCVALGSEAALADTTSLGNLPLLGPPTSTPAPDALTLQTTLLQTELEIGFGLVCVLMQGVLLWRSRATPEAVLRNITVTLVATLSIAVVMTGFPSAQISPIIGLFGTIIGFLLGQQFRSSDPPAVRADAAVIPAAKAPAPLAPAQPDAAEPALARAPELVAAGRPA